MSDLKYPLPDKVYCYTNGRTKAIRTSREPTTFSSTPFVRETQLKKAEAILGFYKDAAVKDADGNRPFDKDLGLKAMEYFNGK